MCDTIPSPVGLSKRTMNQLPQKSFGPLVYADFFESAIRDANISKELIAYGLMHQAQNVEDELHLWLLCKHIFNHEASMHRYLR